MSLKMETNYKPENKLFLFEDFIKEMDIIFETMPQKRAIVSLNKDKNKTILYYSNIAQISKGLDNLLHNVGLKRADRITIVSPHTSYTTVLTLSLAYLGYTAVLLNASLPVEELEKLIQYSDIKALFTVESVYLKLRRDMLEGIPVFEICNNFTYTLFSDSNKYASKDTNEPINEKSLQLYFLLEQLAK